MAIFQNLPSSVFQWMAIFLSIIIEALPFVLLGSIVSGFIEVYLTPERVHKYLPKQKFLRILFGSLVGFIFPSCECGIVPIITRFLEKKVPSYTAVPFLTTAPIINPIVLFATYSAFGNSFYLMTLRLIGSLLVAICLGILLGFFVNDNILKDNYVVHEQEDFSQLSWGKKLFHALAHAIDEFFDTGRYLIFGSLVASAMQIYIPTHILRTLGKTPLLAILVLMLMAFILSLCSEADAFIGASLLSTFGVGPVMAFLLIGPMVDIKNLMMMLKSFKLRFIGQFIGVASSVIIVYCLFVGVL
ncbi:permease [Streptococcus sobrinus]|uniref:permease n=2 Tax=Streptococcus sobrinus TaxID=1310 RepID=UPI0003042413|nr:permease [Streptococcus sobrinus]